MALKNRKIGFIGAGAMAEALINGLLQAKTVAGSALLCSDTNADRLEYIRQKYNINIVPANADVVKSADVVILAVKPFVMEKVLKETGPHFVKGQVVISIAAGITAAYIEDCLPQGVPVIRVMPNTPSLIGMGASAIALGKNAKAKDGRIAEEIFAAVGKAVMVNESMMDAVTGLSGSGPAYIYLMLEALIDAGVRVGIPRDTSLTLAVQTMLGAAQMVAQTGESPARLKEMVTTPGGTTIAGLHQLEEGKLRATIMNAVLAATKRSEELSGK